MWAVCVWGRPRLTHPSPPAASGSRALAETGGGCVSPAARPLQSPPPSLLPPLQQCWRHCRLAKGGQVKGRRLPRGGEGALPHLLLLPLLLLLRRPPVAGAAAGDSEWALRPLVPRPLLPRLRLLLVAGPYPRRCCAWCCLPLPLVPLPLSLRRGAMASAVASAGAGWSSPTCCG